MKKTAVFINVGRGKSVNVNDLVESLDEGQPAFAALDVFEAELINRRFYKFISIQYTMGLEGKEST